MAGSRHHHALKYRASLATPLATVVAVADNTKTALILLCRKYVAIKRFFQTTVLKSIIPRHTIPTKKGMYVKTIEAGSGISDAKSKLLNNKNTLGHYFRPLKV